MKSKKKMLAELEVMLRDVFAAREAGTPHAKLARAHGYVDGYMKALLETGMADKRELLALVARQRQVVSGPATAEVRGGFELRPVAAA